MTQIMQGTNEETYYQYIPNKSPQIKKKKSLVMFKLEN